MFESNTYIFIEMEYIAGEQLKKMYDSRLQSARVSLNHLNQEEIEERRYQALLK